MQTHELWAHPSAEAHNIEKIDCTVIRVRNDLLEITYRVEGDISSLVLPDGSGQRTDALWKTTCFELFVGKPDTLDYREFNFSPAGSWAAYEFQSYRAGQRNAAIAAPPDISLSMSDDSLRISVSISLDGLETGDPYNLAAVTEEPGMPVNALWAIAHTERKPDFHDRACFLGRLPAPEHP